MNDSLLRDFQPEEVAIALQQMHPIKSLRLDGMWREGDEAVEKIAQEYYTAIYI